MSSCHLGQYKGHFYIIDEVLIASLPPTKAPVTRMRFEVVPFSCHCVCIFKSIHFGLRTQFLRTQFLRFYDRLHRFRVNRR